MGTPLITEITELTQSTSLKTESTGPTQVTAFISSTLAGSTQGGGTPTQGGSTPTQGGSSPTPGGSTPTTQGGSAPTKTLSSVPHLLSKTSSTPAGTTKAPPTVDSSCGVCICGTPPPTQQGSSPDQTSPVSGPSEPGKPDKTSQAPTDISTPTSDETPKLMSTDKPTSGPTDKLTSGATDKPTSGPTDKSTSGPTDKSTSGPTDKSSLSVTSPSTGSTTGLTGFTPFVSGTVSTKAPKKGLLPLLLKATTPTVRKHVERGLFNSLRRNFH